MSRLRKLKHDFLKGDTMGENGQPLPSIQIVLQPNGEPMVRSNCLDPLATAMILAQASVKWGLHLMALRQQQAATTITLPDGSMPLPKSQDEVTT